MAIAFPGSWAVFAVTKKAPTELLAPLLKNSKAGSVGIKNPEPAARHKRSDVTAAEAQVRVRGKHRVVQQIRRVVVRIDRIDLEVVRRHRTVGRERSGDHFINANARP